MRKTASKYRRAGWTSLIDLQGKVAYMRLVPKSPITMNMKTREATAGDLKVDVTLAQNAHLATYYGDD